ncbi:MAG: glutamate--tRNA ligase [Fervidobacterium sp.]|uniref:Glutamate--tRNA ligase n=1 Tax=Fervidobacterium gondwanense DSM 13020 TaxID=1121883 RepID=A0A1M7T4V0_FERGO|nr:glutamate--tRNA ligase [Fervidobacterium gondwanense]UXF00749.1 glutamyl-tRNA synthetase [Fervidobacterium riparium]SHN65711.1 glutamyl-tRNA synthetase [Fervidobacterium gondwanense DSM 13020]
MVRVRFAPSPTGYLHVGGARTALFNYLFARKMGGKFILRIEDTDIERSEKVFEEQLISALKWLGLDWDEGPDIGGDYGPYRQSERTELYHKYAQELVKQGKAYEVYAYPEEIEAMREQLLAEGKPPHYTREMLEPYNTEERKREYEEKGLRPAIYFSMPRKDYIINDVVKGEVVFKAGSVGDFALLRSNGMPTYNYACVIDDGLMKITHVLRGDDHLSNTVKQVALYEAFGWDTPVFGHVSMILGPDGSKLSKRHGATSVEEFKSRGYLPESLVNFLALLGWSHPEGKEILTKQELVESFSLERLVKNPAIFNPEKLRWMNSEHIRMKPVREIVLLAKEFMSKDIDESYLEKIIPAVKDRIEELSQLPELTEFFFKRPENLPEKTPEAHETYENLLNELKNIENWNKESIYAAFKNVMKGAKLKGKDFYMTLRLVLTGKHEGPELIDILEILGKEEVLARIEQFLSK